MILSFNHVALFVKDVEVSSKFYEEVLGLKKIARPAFDFPGAWFQIPPSQQLHLIGGSSDLEILKLSKPRGNHLAFQVTSHKETETRLKSKGVEYFPPKRRPDGAMQIFLRDPDGYFLELVELIEA